MVTKLVEPYGRIENDPVLYKHLSEDWEYSVSIVILFDDFKMIVHTIWATSWQNQRNGMCAHRRLRSAWASTQSDQSLRCPHEESLGPYLPTKCTAKTLIRLGGCPGWSESSLGAHAILLVLSWGGSYEFNIQKPTKKRQWQAFNTITYRNFC